MALMLPLPALLLPLLLAVAAAGYYAILLPWHRRRCRRRYGVAPDATAVAFFHPYW